MAPWCNVCGASGPFLHAGWGREGSICSNCGAAARSRTMVYALGACLGLTTTPLASWPELKDLCALEVSGRGGYPVFLTDKLCYHSGEYPQFDLERLPCRDDELDFFLAGDVLEHVQDDGRAFREVYRALKAGGRLLFTVPYEHHRIQTLVRVEWVDGEAQFVEPPEYHGGGGQNLAYRTYGRDLLERLRAVGFAVVHWTLDLPEHGISGQDVFLCAKDSQIELHTGGTGAQIAASSVPLFPLRAWAVAKYNLRALAQVAREVRGRFGW